jgi:hypothetical protein
MNKQEAECQERNVKAFQLLQKRIEHLDGLIESLKIAQARNRDRHSSERMALASVRIPKPGSFLDDPRSIPSWGSLAMDEVICEQLSQERSDLVKSQRMI